MSLWTKTQLIELIISESGIWSQIFLLTLYSGMWSFWVLHKLGLLCFVFVFASQFAVCLQVLWTPPNTTGGGLPNRDHPYVWIIPFRTPFRFYWVWFDSCSSVTCYLSWFLLDLLVYYKTSSTFQLLKGTFFQKTCFIIQSGI